AHALHRLLHFGGRNIADMSGNRPTMTKRVLDLAVTVAPEHVCDRHGSFGSKPDRSRGHCIGILDIEMDGDRRALEGSWSERSLFRHFIDQHHRRIAYADAGMHEPSVWARQSRCFSRTECLLVELDCLGRTCTNEMWRHRVHAVWNRVDIAHTATPCACDVGVGQEGSPDSSASGQGSRWRSWDFALLS